MCLDTFELLQRRGEVRLLLLPQPRELLLGARRGGSLLRCRSGLGELFLRLGELLELLGLLALQGRERGGLGLELALEVGGGLDFLFVLGFG